MAEDAGFSMFSLLILGAVGLVAVGGVFALIFWMLGRGKDDDTTS